ncbi:MAG: lytic transglycosylase domain-containing protein [Alicyclobacillus sp.]|nr:lytic transglycosylase domain-containing protein [Alicyclobacillus sp.]
MTVWVLNRRTLFSVVLLIFVVILIMSNAFWRWMYPISYQSAIQQAARQSQVDPLLVASVVHVESKYDWQDVSHAGAIGLMQLMPATAQWIAQQIMTEYPHGDGVLVPGRQISLASPEVNIRLGSWYIHYLVAKFNGNTVAAIAAYNAGPKRVQDWLRSGTWNGKLDTIASIPVGETRHFVDRVFYNYELYKRIYGRDPAWRREA